LEKVESAHLLFDGSDDFLAAVADVHTPQACGAVDEFASAIVFDEDTSPLIENERTVLEDRGNGRKRMQMAPLVHLSDRWIVTLSSQDLLLVD
jgi:hypothetical protein